MTPRAGERGVKPRACSASMAFLRVEKGDLTPEVGDTIQTSTSLRLSMGAQTAEAAQDEDCLRPLVRVTKKGR